MKKLILTLYELNLIRQLLNQEADVPQSDYFNHDELNEIAKKIATYMLHINCDRHIIELVDK